MLDTGLKNFAARYPKSHDYAADQLEERGRQCSRCDKWFNQQRIDQPWLESMQENRPDLLKAFLKTCEVEVVDGRRHVYFPARCPQCDRAILERQFESERQHAYPSGDRTGHRTSGDSDSSGNLVRTDTPMRMVREA